MTVPLTLALEYVAKYRAELEREFPAEAVFRAALTESTAGPATDRSAHSD